MPEIGKNYICIILLIFHFPILRLEIGKIILPNLFFLDICYFPILRPEIGKSYICIILMIFHFPILRLEIGKIILPNLIFLDLFYFPILRLEIGKIISPILNFLE
jgi:hypothetical protein